MTSKKNILCLIILLFSSLFACNSDDSEDYSPYLKVVNSSGSRTIEMVKIDWTGENLVEGNFIGPSDFRRFSLNKGDHYIRLEIPGHPDSPVSYDNYFNKGYYLEIDVWENSVFFTDFYNEDYWDLD